MPVRQVVAVAAVGLLAVGCLTDESAVNLVAASLEKVATDDSLVAPAGARLPMPLRVTARAADGSVVPRAQVHWEVVSGPGGASLSDAVTVSDGLGVAQVEMTLGPLEGTYMVRAALGNDMSKTVMFSAEATPAPMILSVSPLSFTSGDQLTVTGSNFTQTTGFLVGGGVAEVLSVSANGMQAVVLVPPCLIVGPVDIQATFSGAISAGVGGMYVASGDVITLAVGQYVSMSPDAISNCAMFPSAGAQGAQYLVAPQSMADEGDSTLYQLRGTASSPALAVRHEQGSDVPVDRAFHDMLRALEREIAKLPRPPLALKSQAAAPLITVGHRRDFVVCSELPCGTVPQFASIRAEAMFVGEHSAIYQDLEAPEGGFTDADFQSLGTIFDEELYDVDTRAFGAESDIDENGLVVILLSPEVNRLTDKEDCNVSFVSGFFFPIDIDPAFARDSRSNQAEVFYSIVPDPEGTISCDFATSRIRNTTPVTFVHEFQHMINYHQKVLLRNSNSSETLWLNEGLSHIAEELAARRFRDLGDSTLFSRFAIGDVVNAYDYLEDPGATFVLASEGTGSLAERGSVWLLLRYLLDQHGESLTRRLTETALFGTANVESATGMPMTQILGRWFLANWVSDLPDFDAAPELRYTSWEFRNTYESLNNQAPETFERPYPLEPEEFAGSTSFNRMGVLRAGSGDYFIVNQGPGDPGVSLEFTLPGGSPIPDGANARLNVIRIK